MASQSFSELILQWYDHSGRHDLPWQKNQTAYRVWVSEIMLQQTQVNTVIPYYLKFMQRFPNLKSLSKAPLDDVLHHWSGLGYYARARNLHRSAQIILEEHKGRFPQSITEIEKLPGIGHSTAGAILSLAMNQQATILDGNVKRVLTRFYAFNENLTKKSALDKLWYLADNLTPKNRCRDYNQALMDLGALICTRSAPKCTSCPLEHFCQAHQAGQETQYPIKKTSSKRPQKEIFVLILQDQKGNILLEKRPHVGIWGGLWSFPECNEQQQIKNICKQRFFCEVTKHTDLPVINHIFTHFELMIKPVKLSVRTSKNHVMDSDSLIWYNNKEKLPGGIPSPIAKILQLI